jgi:ABC-type transporter Mla MlaB component
MAFFPKPPAKKTDPAKPKVGPTAATAAPPHVAASARDVAVQAQGRRSAPERPRAEPAGDISVTGASLIEWSPARTSIEVGQTNPGLCAVLENAALLYAGGQSQPARDLLDQGVRNDPETRNSPLAWLALFDLQQRASDRAAFDELSLQYVVQFERSPPSWEENSGARAPATNPKSTAGGYAVLTGKLTAATAPQIEALRRTMAKQGVHAKLDLASVAGFDAAGAALLAKALADARKHRYTLTLQRTEKVRAALEILVRRGRDAGEGSWLLLLELLQFEGKQDPFDERAIEYAIAFEQSPPSWEPPLVPPAETPAKDAVAGAVDDGQVDRSMPAGVELVVWSGVLSGSCTPQMALVSEYSYNHAVVPIDLSAVERIDFVCAGSLLNVINRVESQRKAVQIVGASPIIRALLLLIGISPRHFLKKSLY